MADEIKFAYQSGYTLTYGVYDEDGSVVTAAGTSLPEEGTTGYYHATDANISALDVVIIKESTNIVGYAQYSPDVTSTAIDADLTTIETKIDDLIVDQNKVTNIYEEPDDGPRPIVSVSG